MDQQPAHSTPTTTSGITTSSITTSAPTSKSVIVDPSSSDEKNSSFSLLSEAHETPKRVSSSTISSPLLTPPGKVIGRNYNGTSE